MRPSSELIDLLTKKIDTEYTEYGQAFAFGFTAKDDHGHLIGGCNGSVVYGSIYTDQLWVDKDYRNQGVGRRLMEAVHALGIETGCSMAAVNMMSFQGTLPFYEKLGYRVEFERHGYPNQARLLFLIRSLE